MPKEEAERKTKKTTEDIDPALFVDEPPKKKKGRLRKFFFIFLVIAAVGFFFNREPLIQGEAIFKSKSLLQLGPTQSGVLQEVFYRDGDIAEKGEALARLENSELTKTLQEKELSLEILIHDQARLRGKKELLQKRMNGTTLLFENGAISRFDFEALGIELVHLAEELSIREREIEMAKREVYYLKGKLEHLVIKAPYRGLIIKDPTYRVGNLIKEGEALFELADPSDFYVELPVKESEVRKLRIGSQADVSFYAFPSETYQGKIIRIGSKTEEKVEKVFKVEHVVLTEIKLTKIPEMARYGMRAFVKFKSSGQSAKIDKNLAPYLSNLTQKLKKKERGMDEKPKS